MHCKFGSVRASLAVFSWRGELLLLHRRGVSGLTIGRLSRSFAFLLPLMTIYALPRILREIDEASEARVPALRLWCEDAGSGVSAAVARGISAGEPAAGASGAAPCGAPMGKRKANVPAGEDNCAEESFGRLVGGRE